MLTPQELNVEAYCYLAKAALVSAAEVRRQRPDLAEHFPPAIYQRQLRTLSIKGPRGSGHTTATGKLAIDLTGAAIVITPTHYASRHFYKKFNFQSIPVDCLEHATLPRQLSVVILESACDFKDAQIAYIYTRFANYTDIFFILLG